MTKTIQLREGDVFRFTYSDTECAKSTADLRWCVDGQVVVRDGRLCDTYWGFDASEPRIVRPDQGTLMFVCNLNDVREIKDYEARHYDEADVFNLTHHHGYRKRFVVRKDAQPSAERMLREIDAKAEAVRKDLESATRSALWDYRRLGELRARIESGDISQKPWW